ncbi:type II toxin-antitoxin system VapC family toxin [Bradymonas sediminis]|uniref:Uncharacterized protein n=1 Tax=Bradymonas sediminis TaxID=1548548 RepID=A0A2Z4FJ69_9DELT|nr:type II toxin-antitoxin system VapC family toxin [Bradymonas sediminis]AWV88728.1 hypothetical protein DN745_05005 [Bradymonas sediminis]TDP63579.1 Zc3h12a-like ribonuclease protein [Bradymonas sediminis]
MDLTQYMPAMPLSLLEIILIALLLAIIGRVVFRLLQWRPGRPQKPARPKRRASKARLNAAGWTLLVDGSNFAHRDAKGGTTKVRLDYLMEVLRVLEHRFKNAKIKVFCDANLRYKLNKTDQPKFIAEVERRKPRFFETHGKSADDVLLQYARKNKKCIIVSNDRFSKGDEPALRIGTPLLKISISARGVRLPLKFDHFRDPDRPSKNSRTPLNELF